MKKYEITNETIRVYGKTFYRIKSLINFGNVTQGTLGGFIEKETNLSHDGNAWVYDDAKVYGNACVCDNARVYDNALVGDDAKVYGNAKVRGNAMVRGNAWVCDDAKVYGNACVCDNAKVCGNAEVYDDADYLYFRGLGSCNRNTTFFKCCDGHIHVSCGCFHGNLAEFENRVRETHGDTKYAKEYLACVTAVKIHFGIE